MIWRGNATKSKDAIIAALSREVARLQGVEATVAKQTARLERLTEERGRARDNVAILLHRLDDGDRAEFVMSEAMYYEVKRLWDEDGALADVLAASTLHPASAVLRHLHDVAARAINTFTRTGKWS